MSSAPKRTMPLTPAQHTRRAILKAFKRLNIEHVDNTRKDDESGFIQWLSFTSGFMHSQRHWHTINVYADGTANGSFPPEMFSFFCPEV